MSEDITALVVRMATENVAWGYDRIQGALANLGYTIAPNTVKNVERNHQGLGNRLLQPATATGSQHGRIQRRERLGGVLNFYYREAA